MIWKIAGVLLVLLIIGGAYLFISYRQAIGVAERAWASIEQGALTGEQIFDPSMVEDLPEAVQRYFTHAIAPGTPLRTTVELQMRGNFLLGDRAKFQTYDMEARQILPPLISSSGCHLYGPVPCTSPALTLLSAGKPVPGGKFSTRTKLCRISDRR